MCYRLLHLKIDMLNVKSYLFAEWSYGLKRWQTISRLVTQTLQVPYLLRMLTICITVSFEKTSKWYKNRDIKLNLKSPSALGARYIALSGFFRSLPELCSVTSSKEFIVRLLLTANYTERYRKGLSGCCVLTIPVRVNYNKPVDVMWAALDVLGLNETSNAIDTN